MKNHKFRLRHVLIPLDIINGYDSRITALQFQVCTAVSFWFVTRYITDGT